MDEREKRWQCEFCQQYKAVPSLARDCEQRHREEWSGKSLKSRAG